MMILTMMMMIDNK